MLYFKCVIIYRLSIDVYTLSMSYINGIPINIYLSTSILTHMKCTLGIKLNGTYIYIVNTQNILNHTSNTYIYIYIYIYIYTIYYIVSIFYTHVYKLHFKQ